jgi:uncharacterized protein
MDLAALDPFTLLACAGGVLAAYVIFGLTSFGAPLVAAPILAHFLPLTSAIPLQATLDLTASLVLGGRERRQVDWLEVKWLAVPMLLGMVLGATLLAGLPRRAALVGLGVFVAAYGAAGLAGWLHLPKMPRPAAFIIAIIGGALSTLFAAGGPLYVMLLTNRIADPGVLRSTIAACALMSAAIRVAVFAAGGFLASGALWWSLVALLPCLLAGVFAGRWLQRRLAANVNRALIHALLVVSGASLVWRFF